MPRTVAARPARRHPPGYRGTTEYMGSSSAPANERRRTELVVRTLEDAFAPLMRADPAAFRGKFRTMASDPHAFYRGSACLFYADVTREDDPFADDRTGGIWVH